MQKGEKMSRTGKKRENRKKSQKDQTQKTEISRKTYKIQGNDINYKEKPRKNVGKVEVVGIQSTVSIGAHAPELFTLINTGRTKVFQRGKSPSLARITTKLCHFEMKSLRT